MSTQVQWRRGSASQHGTFTGANSEVTVDTTSWTLRVHDGVTQGGYELVSNTATQTLLNKTLNSATLNTPTIAGNASISGNLIPSANVVYSLGSSSNRWKDLWVSGSTIYIGNETMSVDSSGQWTFSSNGSSISMGKTTEFNPSSAHISGVLKASGNIVAVATTTSTSATTGALVVNGGVGIAGNVFTAGWLVPTGNTTQNLGSTTNWWGTIFGVSQQAKYADLAENYVSDIEYNPGTVLVFGGDCEVTVTNKTHDTAVAGVVSTNPAYLMNATSGNVSVALTGRVPCLVKGPVNKGSILVTSDIQGAAEAIDMSKYNPGCVLGKSLEKIDDNSLRIIEVVVGRF